MGARVEAHLVQVLKQRGHRMRVVGHVQHQGGLPSDGLESPRQLHQCQAAAHGLRTDRQAFAHGVEGGQHARRVEQLVGAAQRGIGHAVEALGAAGPVPLLLVARAVEVAPAQPQVGVDLLGAINQALRRHRVADDGWLAGSHDAGLLEADGLARGAQVFDVVDVDAGDDGAVGVDDVHCVEPAAQPHFENHQVQRCQRHQPRDGQRGELEVGQAHVAAGLLDGLEMRQQLIGGDALPVDAATLLKVHQVRLDVQADAIAGLHRNRLQHRAGRAFAVGACHGENGRVELQRQALLDLQHAIQREVHFLGMQALAAGEPFVEGGRQRHRP